MSPVLEVHVPQENVNDDAVTINRWLVKDGTAVKEGQPLVEVETSKADFEIPAPGSGFVKHLAPEGADVPVGAAVCLIGESLEALSAASPQMAAVATTPAAQAVAVPSPAVNHVTTAPASTCAASTAPALNNVASRFSRSARELMQQAGLDVKIFANRGLVRTEDVRAFMGQSAPHAPSAPASASHSAQTATPSSAPARSTPQPALGVPVKIEKLTRSKQMEIRYLRSAFDNVIPSTVAVTARHFPHAATAEGADAPGFSATILFEAARLLRKYPLFNGFYAEGHAHLYQEINIGFAVDVGEGLRVVVIRNADQKSLQQIQDEQRELVVQTLSGELRPETLSGGTFTITDLTAEGVSTFVPLINQGQSAILGIGAPDLLRRPPTYEMILSFDHQLSEGRAAAQFLNDLRHRLEAHEQNLAPAPAAPVPAPESAPPRDVEAESVDGTACHRCGTPMGDLPDGHFMLMGYTRSGKSPQPICTICVQDF